MEFDLAQTIKALGFPVVAAGGMGYFIYFIWKWVTETIDPVLGETMGTLIKLVDRIRMLDNDMIRLNSKLNMVLEYREHLDRDKQDELQKLVEEYKKVDYTKDSFSAEDLKTIKQDIKKS